MRTYGYGAPQYLWETDQQADQRQYYETKQQQDLARDLAFRQLQTEMNFAGDTFNNQLRLLQMQQDYQNQLDRRREALVYNQRYLQSANLDVTRLGRQRAEQGEIEVTNPMQRARRAYGY